MNLHTFHERTSNEGKTVHYSLTFVLLMALMITGIIPDTNFAFGATFTHATVNDFGTFVAKVSNASLSNFTGSLLFDMMEHVTLIVPGLFSSGHVIK